MKIILSTLVICLCGSVGIVIKNKIKDKIGFYNFIKSYVVFCYQNISIFKNDLIKITDNFIISKNTKNAKFCKIFAKTNQVYKINAEILKEIMCNDIEVGVIYSYLSSIGKSDYIEMNRSYDAILNFICDKTKEAEDKLKVNGELYFKISLAIGAVLAILIW